MAAAVPFIGLGLSAIGTVGGVVSAIGQSNVQAAQASAARSQGAMSAAMYMYNAQEAKAASDRQLYIQQTQARKVMASQRAGYAKAGLLVEGTPLEVMADSAANAEFDALALKHQGEMALWRGQAGAASALAGGNYAGDMLNDASGTTLLTSFAKAGLGFGQYFNDKFLPSFNNSITIPRYLRDGSVG